MTTYSVIVSICLETLNFTEQLYCAGHNYTTAFIFSRCFFFFYRTFRENHKICDFDPPFLFTKKKVSFTGRTFSYDRHNTYSKKSSVRCSVPNSTRNIGWHFSQDIMMRIFGECCRLCCMHQQGTYHQSTSAVTTKNLHRASAI